MLGPVYTEIPSISWSFELSGGPPVDIMHLAYICHTDNQGFLYNICIVSMTVVSLSLYIRVADARYLNSQL